MMMAETMGHTQGSENMATGGSGLCIHAIQGAAPAPKTCINGYQCGHCAYDQWIEALEHARPTGKTRIEAA